MKTLNGMISELVAMTNEGVLMINEPVDSKYKKNINYISKWILRSLEAEYPYFKFEHVPDVYPSAEFIKLFTEYLQYLDKLYMKFGEWVRPEKYELNLTLHRQLLAEFARLCDSHGASNIVRKNDERYADYLETLLSNQRAKIKANSSSYDIIYETFRMFKNYTEFIAENIALDINMLYRKKEDTNEDCN